MGQVLHGSATTTEAVRRAIQHSQESLRTLSKRYGINPKTVAKWKKRSSIADLRPAPGSRDRLFCLRGEALSLPSADTRCCRSTIASTLAVDDPHLTALHYTAVCSATALAIAGYRGRQASEEEVQEPIRSASSHRYRGGRTDRASCTCSSPSTGRRSCLRRTAREAPTAFQRVSAAPDRGRPLQDPHRSHRQRHQFTTPGAGGSAVPLIKERSQWRVSGLMPSNTPVPRTISSIEPQAKASMDQRPGRAHEPHHQGRTVKRFHYDDTTNCVGIC